MFYSLNRGLLGKPTNRLTNARLANRSIGLPDGPLPVQAGPPVGGVAPRRVGAESVLLAGRAAVSATGANLARPAALRGRSKGSAHEVGIGVIEAGGRPGRRVTVLLRWTTR